MLIVFLQQTGADLTGEAKNGLGDKWLLSGHVSATTAGLDAAVAGDSICSFFRLYADTFERDGSAAIVGMRGGITGRCYGTRVGTFVLRRE
ncbi:hypothetical protein EG835_05545 [bacterium]|nr:hypothetical protein [bacterium]